MENRELGAGNAAGSEQEWTRRGDEWHKALAALESAPEERPVSDMQVVIVYMATSRQVEHTMRDAEHVFRFTDELFTDELEGYPPLLQRQRNAHATRDRFLKVKTWNEAYDFLCQTGQFSAMDDEITWSEFHRWQQFAGIVHLRAPLEAETREPTFTGDAWEVLKALTGDSLFPCSFFDVLQTPQTPAEEARMQREYRDHPELVGLIENDNRTWERELREQWNWFHHPPVTLEWVPATARAELQAIQYFEKVGFGPWTLDFLLPKKELRPVIVIRPKTTLQAIAAAIYADHIHGVEWRKCAWEKCGEIFKIGKAKGRRFCNSAKCKNNKHSQELRDRRKKEAESAHSATPGARKKKPLPGSQPTRRNKVTPSPHSPSDLTRRPKRGRSA